MIKTKTISTQGALQAVFNVHLKELNLLLDGESSHGL